MMARKTKIMNVPIRLMCILALAASATGCIKENVSDCIDSYKFTVRAYADTGSELSPEVVKDVALYVFDDQMRFVELIDAQIGQSVEIDAPVNGNGGIHIVVWGNLGGGGQSVTSGDVGDHKDEHAVNLLTTTRADEYHASPDDLFHGQLTVTAEQMRDSHVIPIYRSVGSMTVTVRKLQEFTGFYDDDYSIVIRKTNSSLDFYGKPVEGDAAYRPTGAFVTNNGKQEYRVPAELDTAFNVIPGQADAIDIYHGDTLVASVSKDSDGKPIVVEKDETANVLVDFGAQLGVSVTVTPWGEYQVGKEF